MSPYRLRGKAVLSFSGGRAAHDAAAPMVRELAAQAMNAQEIGEAMKTSHTRIRLIAQENSITLGGST